MGVPVEADVDFSEQTLRWFGTPWPRPSLRAAVCEDDQYRVPVPEQECARCGEAFQAGHRLRGRGVAIPAMRGDHGWEWAYYHALCFMGSVVGPGLAERVSADWL